LRCDTEEGGEIGRRRSSRCWAAARSEVEGSPRFARFSARWHVRVREAAIELIGSHAEVEEVPTAIAAALSAKQAGLVATAHSSSSRIRPGHERCQGTRRRRRSKLGKRSIARSRRRRRNGRALIEAAGAGYLGAAVPKLEGYCAHPNPTLRGTRRARCPF